MIVYLPAIARTHKQAAAIEEAAHPLQASLGHRDQCPRMSQDSRRCLTVRLYKNRELVQVHDVQQQWNSGRWWEEVSGTLRKATDNAFAKYEGYDVQELHIETADKRFQYSPAKACILWRIHHSDRGDGVDEVDAAIEQHNATMYETVHAHPPVSPLSIGGHRVVPCSLNASPHQADISNLSKTVWKQLGQTGDPTILLLKLKKQRLSEEEVTVAKDDVTGDVYPYRITRVLYLTRQDRKDKDAQNVVDDVDTGDDGDDEPVVGWGVKGVDDGQEGAPHDIATLLAQGFLQRPSAQGMTVVITNRFYSVALSYYSHNPAPLLLSRITYHRCLPNPYRPVPHPLDTPLANPFQVLDG